MLACVNVKKHYFSNTVHYCRSSMPLLVFYKAPPSKHSLLWLANWSSALWLAEHHKPCRKCNSPFHNRELQFFKTKLKTVNNVLFYHQFKSERGTESWWSSYVFANKLRLWCDLYSLSLTHTHTQFCSWLTLSHKHTQCSKLCIWTVNSKYFN